MYQGKLVSGWRVGAALLLAVAWGCNRDTADLAESSAEPAAETVKPEPFPPGQGPDDLPPAGSRKGARSKGGPGGKRGPRKTNVDEQAVIDLLNRVGGRFERIDIGQGRGPIGVVEMPGTKATVEDLQTLKKLRDLVAISLSGPAFSDTAIKELKAFRSLENVHLIGSTFTDAALRDLSSFRDLRVVILENVNVSSQGLTALQKIADLQFVDIVHMEVTPEILAGLLELRQVRELRLVDAKISDADLKKLQKGLSDCDIVQQDTVQQDTNDQ